MKISGQAAIDATPEAIWPLIFDPGVLLRLMPGCDDIEQVAANEYHAHLTIPVPAIAGGYHARVKIIEYEVPLFCRLDGEALGPGGSVRGGARFSLVPEAAGTRITYDADAQISGPLASMNPRFAEGVAQTLIQQGLARIPDLVRECEAAEGKSLGDIETQPGAGSQRKRIGSLRTIFHALLAGLRAWLAGLRRQRRYF